MMKHTLAVLVQNKSGVLSRVAALFSRRGYNIDSLAVGVTETPRSRELLLSCTGMTMCSNRSLSS